MGIETNNSRRVSVETVKEAMGRLKIGRDRMKRCLSSGEIESYVDGGRRKVFSKSVDTFILLRLLTEAEGGSRRPKRYQKRPGG